MIAMRSAPGFRFSLALVFVVLVFSPLQLVSQVIIKEKVEIHPKSPPPVRTQSAALLQIVASWSVSGEIDPSPGPGLGMINQPCGITATGELIKTAPAVSGGFFIGASVRTLGSVHYELLVQVGGTEVLRQEGELPGNILFLLQPEVVLHSGVAFHGEQQTLIHGAGTLMKLGTPSEHPLQLCGETIWHQKMPTTFTIVQGAALGSFYDTLGAKIGTSVQWTEDTIGAIRFVADGDQPSNPEGEDVVIEASNSTGILGQTTIRVFPFEETIVVDHFEVTAGTDTLLYGSSTPLVIVGKDAEGREPQGEDQDFLVALSLEGGGGSAGSFVVTVPFMDTTFVFPDQFMFSYTVYKSGLFSIAYLANGEFPAGPEPGTVKIKAALETDPEVTGETQVVIVPQKPQLEIVDHAPWAVWPHLPPQSNGRSRGADRPGYDPKRSFIIKVRNASGQPLINEQVEIKTEFVPLTGGHEHNNPVLLQDKQGMFYGQGRNGNPLDGLLTDIDGMVVIDSLIASQVSGKYIITAWLTSDPDVKDTVQLNARVPGLLTFSPGASYELSGRRNEHPANHHLASQAALAGR